MDERIYDEVLAFIADPQRGSFDDLALEVFEFQFRRNEPYRRFCERRGRTPDTVTHWREIPAVPTSAFKELDLVCGPPEKVFLTSGTTQGAGKRGRHGFPRLALYHASLLPTFQTFLLPDGARLRMVILTPPPQALPASSLVHMLEVVRGTFGAEGSGYFIDGERLQFERLLAELDHASETGDPLFLLGTTFSFVHLFDRCLTQGLRFHLPPGSRVMDTGGSKGRSREITAPELYRLCWDLLGIPDPFVVNEYGMTEMGSQFYDNSLRNYVRGIQEARSKVGPPWVRTLVMDQELQEEVPSGGIGLLRHFDLANAGSVMAIQTEDLGCRIGSGFEVIGRARGAEARGCSLALEELLSLR